LGGSGDSLIYADNTGTLFTIAGTSWLTTGNSGLTSPKFGTLDNTPIDIVVNNSFAMTFRTDDNVQVWTNFCISGNNSVGSAEVLVIYL